MDGPMCESVTPNLPWLDVALASRFEFAALDRAGVSIACSIWEPEVAEAGFAPVLLVHGTAANRHWWDAVAPLLARKRRVVAVDLPGHGDSGRRDAYELASWAADIMAVTHEFAGARPWLVGHSMGGLVVLQAENNYGSQIGGLVVLDTPIEHFDAEMMRRRVAIARRTPKRFPSRDAAIASFNTKPAASGMPAALRSHIAAHSFIPDGSGWIHHGDRAVYRRPSLPQDFPASLRIPTTWVRAEHGLVDRATVAAIQARAGANVRLVEAPVVGHHLLLEAPLATACLIEAAIATNSVHT
jgi:pimeloyl-ACP methyl ester carboxylesterase